MFAQWQWYYNVPSLPLWIVLLLLVVVPKTQPSEAGVADPGAAVAGWRVLRCSSSCYPGSGQFRAVRAGVGHRLDQCCGCWAGGCSTAVGGAGCSTCVLVMAWCGCCGLCGVLWVVGVDRCHVVGDWVLGRVLRWR